MLWAAITVGVLVVMIVLIVAGYAGTDGEAKAKESGCADDRRDVLAAQAVPGAQYVPCFTQRVAVWSVRSERYSEEGVHIELSDEGRKEADWRIDFTASCVPPPDASVVRRQGDNAAVHQRTETIPDGVRRSEWMQFPGGCVTSQLDVTGRVDQRLIFEEVDDLLRLVPRSVIDRQVTEAMGGEVRLDPPNQTTPAPVATTGTAPPSSPDASTSTDVNEPEATDGTTEDPPADQSGADQSGEGHNSGEPREDVPADTAGG